MKKLFALLMALVMALGCFSALAEDAPELVPCVSAIVSLDKDFVTAYAAMMDQPGTTTYADMATVILSMLEKMDLTIVCGDDYAVATLEANGQALATINALPYAEGYALVSDLLPNYAAYISADELMALVESASPVSTNGVTIGDQTLSMEQVTELATAAMPYLNDLMAYLGTVEPAHAEQTDEGAYIHYPVTTHNVADILKLLLTRLSTDEVLKPYAKMAMDKVMEMDQSADWYIKKGLGRADALLAAKAETLVNLEVWTEGEDVVAYIYTDTIILSISTGEYEGSPLYTVTLIASEQPVGNSEAWDAKYEAIGNGETEGVSMFEFRMANDSNEEALGGRFSLELLFGDQDVLLSGSYLSAGELGTADYFGRIELNLNPGLTGSDLITLGFALTFVEAPEALSLEGKTIVDVLTMDEAAQQALTNDLMSYGLPALLGAAQQAMPEDMAVLIPMLMGGNE